MLFTRDYSCIKITTPVSCNSCTGYTMKKLTVTLTRRKVNTREPSLEMSQPHSEESSTEPVLAAPVTLAATAIDSSEDEDENEDEELLHISLPQAMPCQHRLANPCPGLLPLLPAASPPPPRPPSHSHYTPTFTPPSPSPPTTGAPVRASHPCPPAPYAPPTCRRSTGSDLPAPQSGTQQGSRL